LRNNELTETPSGNDSSKVLGPGGEGFQQKKKSQNGIEGEAIVDSRFSLRAVKEEGKGIKKAGE